MAPDSHAVGGDEVRNVRGCVVAPDSHAVGGDEVRNVRVQRRENQVQEEALPQTNLSFTNPGAGPLLPQVRREQGGGGESAEDPPDFKQGAEKTEIKEVAKSQKTRKNFRINSEENLKSQTPSKERLPCSVI